MFTALLDTCVLWPSLQRDFLLSLAIEGMYRPIWSAAILEELEYHETTKLIRRGVDLDQSARRAKHLVARLREAFPDAEVGGWEGLDGMYGLPDPDDEHVVAAAVIGRADAIVTHNLKDFPQESLPPGIQVVSPQEFAANSVLIDPACALLAVSAIAERSGRKGPQLTVDDVLEMLRRRYEMTRAVKLLRRFSRDHPETA